MGMFGGGEVSRNEFDRLLRRVEQLERQLASLTHHGDASPVISGAAPAGPDLSEVIALVHQGKKINAIKIYRELTGAGLKEAKDAVEHL